MFAISMQCILIPPLCMSKTSLHKLPTEFGSDTGSLRQVTKWLPVFNIFGKTCLAGASRTVVPLARSLWPGCRRCAATRTCLPAVSTSQTSIKTLGKEERQSERDPSHLSPRSSEDVVPGLLGGVEEEVRDETVSGSNNKEVPPHTSFLRPSPSVAAPSFKSFKSSPT